MIGKILNTCEIFIHGYLIQLVGENSERVNKSETFYTNFSISVGKKTKVSEM